MTPNAQKKLRTNFSDRQADAAEAKKALLAKFKPKPTVQAEAPVDRAAEKAAELERVRTERSLSAARSAITSCRSRPCPASTSRPSR